MNPTPSQPERPEPQWRDLSDGEHIADGDERTDDGKTWVAVERFTIGCQFRSYHLLPRYRRRVATRTPAPEAVAGERKIKDGPVRSEDGGAGGPDEYPDLSIATPPVEADKDAEKLREEVEAFVKHTGAPNFKEAVDVLIRTNAGHMEQVEKQFNKIKDQGRELTTVRATIAELRKRIAELVGALEAAPHVAPCLAGTPEYLRIKDYADRGGYACKCWKSALARAAEGKEQA